MVTTGKFNHLFVLKNWSFLDAKSIYYGSRIEAQRNEKLLEQLYRGKIGDTSKSTISRRDWLNYGYCLIMVARYWASAYALNSVSSNSSDKNPNESHPNGYFRYDIVMEAVHRKGHFDKMAFLLVAFLLLYCIAVHYIRNYRVDLPILEQLQAMTVEGRRRLASAYPQFSVSFASRNVLQVFGILLAKKFKLARSVDKLSATEEAHGAVNSKFGGGQGFRSFAQMVQLSMTIEAVNVFVFVVLKLVTIASVISYTLFSVRTRPQYSGLQLAFIAFDRLALMNVAAEGLNNLLLGTYLQKIFSSVFGAQFVTLTKAVAAFSLELKKAKGKVNLLHFSSLLHRHTALVAAISHLNKRVVSVELFIFVISNIPFNIYLTTRILLGIRPQLLVLVVTLFQLSAAVVSNFAAISLNSRLHSVGRQFASVQFYLTNSQVELPSENTFKNRLLLNGEKIRLLTFYEQLHSCPGSSKLGYTAGPIGVISAYSSFKFIIFYAVYALFSCSLILKNA